MHLYFLFLWIFYQRKINKYWADFFFFLEYKLQYFVKLYDLGHKNRQHILYYLLGASRPTLFRPYKDINGNEYPPLTDLDPEDIDEEAPTALIIDGRYYHDFIIPYLYKGYYAPGLIMGGFFLFMFLRIQDSLGFYACLHFWIFEIMTFYILCCLTLIHFIFIQTPICHTGFFMVFAWRIYAYYCFATEPYENFKEWERINWKWLHFLMLKLCALVTIITAPFFMYFCVHHFIWCQPFPIL